MTKTRWMRPVYRPEAVKPKISIIDSTDDGELGGRRQPVEGVRVS
jgi:hypothetical protein